MDVQKQGTMWSLDGRDKKLNKKHKNNISKSTTHASCLCQCCYVFWQRLKQCRMYASEGSGSRIENVSLIALMQNKPLGLQSIVIWVSFRFFSVAKFVEHDAIHAADSRLFARLSLSSFT